MQDLGENITRQLDIYPSTHLDTMLSVWQARARAQASSKGVPSHETHRRSHSLWGQHVLHEVMINSVYPWYFNGMALEDKIRVSLDRILGVLLWGYFAFIS
jgi:hypothetical protein